MNAWVDGEPVDGHLPLWLVARPDGSSPRIIRAINAKAAVLERFKTTREPAEDMLWGTLAVWRLGNFPVQYDVTADESGVVARAIGRPSIARRLLRSVH